MDYFSRWRGWFGCISSPDTSSFLIRWVCTVTIPFNPFWSCALCSKTFTLFISIYLVINLSLHHSAHLFPIYIVTLNFTITFLLYLALQWISTYFPNEFLLTSNWLFHSNAWFLDILHSAEEEQPTVLPACVPSRDYSWNLVGGRQCRSWRHEYVTPVAHYLPLFVFFFTFISCHCIYINLYASFLHRSNFGTDKTTWGDLTGLMSLWSHGLTM